MHGRTFARPATRWLGLSVASLLASSAGAQGFHLDSGALIAEDSSSAKQGVYQIVQYSPAGAELSVLATGFPVPYYGVMVGLTIIDGEIWTIGTGAIVARIDLASGQMRDTFFANVYSAEALTRFGSDLLIGAYTGQVQRQKTSGQEVWTFDTGVPMTGIATDGTLIYCGNYQDGNIYVFTQAGAPVSFIPTDIGGYSLSGLAYDSLTGTLLATTGFGDDDVRRYSMTGTPLGSFAVPWPQLNDLEIVPHGCTDLFVPPIAAGATLHVSGYAPPGEQVVLCVALSLAASEAFTIGPFCGTTALSPAFGVLQFVTASDVAGQWSVTSAVPPGILLPVHLQAFASGSCPNSCSSSALTRLIH